MKTAIVTICSDDYVKYASILIKSFYIYNKWFDGDFIVMYDNEYIKLSNKSIKKLKALHNNIKFHKADTHLYIDMCKKFFGNLFLPQYVGCSLKFEIFNLEQYDKLLFLDSDMLVISDISEIFTKDYSFAAVEDYVRSFQITPRDKQYFNVGFMYFGNKKYINKNTLQDIVNLANNINLNKLVFFKDRIINGYKWFEQDILNIYFYGKEDVWILDYTYNSPFSIIDNLLPLQIENKFEKIIHYWTKPSKKLKNYKAIELWYNYENVQINNTIINKNITNKNAILFIMHEMNNFVSAQIKKLYNEIDNTKYDIWILINNKNLKSSKNLFIFNEKVVNDLGFVLHNYYYNVQNNFYGHNFEYSFMSFYKKYPTYDKYWIIEYDVYCNGNWNNVLNFYDSNFSNIDYYGTHISIGKNKNNNVNWQIEFPMLQYNYIKSFKTNKDTLCKSFNAICRLSNKAIETLINYYDKGDYGHYEVTMPTIFYNAGLKLQAFGKETENNDYVTTYKNDEIEYINDTNIQYSHKYTLLSEIEKDKVYHPVKNFLV